MKNLLAFILLTTTTSLAQAHPAQERALLAYLKVKPGTEEQFKAAAEDVIRESRREPGLIIYNLHQSSNEPQQFVFYELFQTQRDLNYHRNAPHVKAFLKKVEQILIPGQFILTEFQTGEL